jgi:hypothetical protein
VRGKLPRSDRALLAKYVRRLDERRVFYHPYDSEVVEACVASLDTVKEFTDETLASLEHQGAKAALGAILDSARAFVDRWKSARTPDFHHLVGDLFDRRVGRSHAAEVLMQKFFEDLGELRGAVKLMVLMLHEIDSILSAPNLTETPDR